MLAHRLAPRPLSPEVRPRMPDAPTASRSAGPGARLSPRPRGDRAHRGARELRRDWPRGAVPGAASGLAAGRSGWRSGRRSPLTCGCRSPTGCPWPRWRGRSTRRCGMRSLRALGRDVGPVTIHVEGLATGPVHRAPDRGRRSMTLLRALPTGIRSRWCAWPATASGSSGRSRRPSPTSRPTSTRSTRSTSSRCPTATRAPTWLATCREMLDYVRARHEPRSGRRAAP